MKTRQLALYSKFHDGEPKWDKQIFTFMFNLLMDFNIKPFRYYQGRNMVYGLRAQSPKYDWDQGSEERAQGSEEWDQGSQGF